MAAAGVRHPPPPPVEAQVPLGVVGGAELHVVGGGVAVVVGHRYSGPDAAAAGIITGSAPLETLTETVVERVAPLAGTAGDNLALIKKQLYPEIAEIAGR